MSDKDTCGRCGFAMSEHTERLEPGDGVIFKNNTFIDCPKRITCKLGHFIGSFDPATGRIVHENIPKNMKVFGVYLRCEKCKRDVRFDAQRERRKSRKSTGLKLELAVE